MVIVRLLEGTNKLHLEKVGGSSGPTLAWKGGSVVRSTIFPAHRGCFILFLRGREEGRKGGGKEKVGKGKEGRRGERGRGRETLIGCFMP